ncbi:helix-turn-helix domain-containing protein [Paenibacillus sp. GCM10012307]|uniref:AraC family transcriptional regulator n=1 Tax=Paenibacillus roseus TaxID=2798579 RepID=A0A934MRF0_9BACL|nr:AraC family transcriptional regulator [Paenibacillus roseus]MBJ6362828.1 AraC family transcriptional regulator [Paenibacillus roseus]
MNASTALPILTFLSPPLPYFIEADRRRYEPGQRHPSRANRGTFDLLYVREGQLSIVEGSHTWVLEPGQLLLLRPDCPHRGGESCRSETVFDWIHFQTPGVWEECEPGQEERLHGDHYLYAIRLPKSMKLTRSQEADELLDELIQAANSPVSASFWQRQQLFVKLLQLIEEEWRSYAAPTSVHVAERAAAYLKRNYQSQISNKSLGEELGLHPNYIARCMIDIYGHTPQQFLMHYRVDQAKLLLIKTDWPIARIASETGFKQTPHFSRTFSEQSGLSPLQYRKKHSAAI